NANTGTGSRIIGTGVPQDVRLASFNCDPRHTTSITSAINLDQNCGAEKASNTVANPNYLGAGAYADAVAIAAAYPGAVTGNFVDNATTGTEWTFNGATWVDSTNPIGTTSHVLSGNVFAAMWENWDSTPNSATGKIDPPLGIDGFTYQNSIKVYDEGGTPHTLTIYFDPVQADTISPADPTQNHWEFIVTMDPTEDVRIFQDNGSGGGASSVPIDKRGILMAGSISFSTSGEIKNMSAYVPTVGGAGFADISTWVAAPISSAGYPMFAANFTGQPNASEIWDPLNMPTVGAPGKLNQETKGYITELNFGLQSTSNWWTIPASGGLTMNQIGQNVANRASFEGHATRTQPSSTAYGSTNGNNFFERYAHQDGYTYGELSSVFVDQDGVLSGRYSNGVTLQLFQITLYDFPSETNLHREGGNLYTQTRESGDPTSGAASSGSFGSIHSNAIEQSNVDLAREFVQMITTQRGFQANSKSITTVDTMLDTVINMKR
ncbi:MAG: flagellar hook-basal body complex protein, partial [Desulfovibrio sp.]|nr:flagellar hook-basal body complex protein [Desulfovibrio sp.]